MSVRRLVPFPVGADGLTAAGRIRVVGARPGPPRCSLEVWPERWLVPGADRVAAIREGLARQLWLFQRSAPATPQTWGPHRLPSGFDLERPCRQLIAEVDGLGQPTFRITPEQADDEGAWTVRALARAGIALAWHGPPGGRPPG